MNPDIVMPWLAFFTGACWGAGFAFAYCARERNKDFETIKRHHEEIKRHWQQIGEATILVRNMHQAAVDGAEIIEVKPTKH